MREHMVNPAMPGHPPSYLGQAGNRGGWAHRVMEILNCEFGESLGYQVLFALGRHSLKPGQRGRKAGMGPWATRAGAHRGPPRGSYRQALASLRQGWPFPPTQKGSSEGKPQQEPCLLSGLGLSCSA